MNFLLILALCLTLGTRTSAQNRPSSSPIPPDNCEGNSARLDSVRNKSIAAGENKTTIAIARLGSGEQSRDLNRRRLYTVRAYLSAMGLPSEKLITAEGERVESYGRIEVYIDGKLVEALSVERCKDLPVGTCENDSEDRTRYQLPLSGKVRLCHR